MAVKIEYWKVATFWLREGEYGSSKRLDNAADVPAAVKSLQQRGFGQVGRDEIRVQHIIIETRAIPAVSPKENPTRTQRQ